MAAGNGATGPLWVRGVCDSVMVKVTSWQAHWASGVVAATREYMSKTGSLEGVPTKRAVTIAWHPKELEHLIRMLKTARPDWQFVVDLEEFYHSGFRRGRLLPGGLHQVEMVAYYEDVKEICEILTNARQGRVGSSQLSSEITGGSFWDAAKR